MSCHNFHEFLFSKFVNFLAYQKKAVYLQNYWFIFIIRGIYDKGKVDGVVT